MTNHDLETKLAQIELIPPSSQYQSEAYHILKSVNQENRQLAWRYVLAFSLILSLGFNLIQYKASTYQRSQGNETMSSEISNAQKPKAGYSIVQGANTPFTTQQNLTVIWR